MDMRKIYVMVSAAIACLLPTSCLFQQQQQQTGNEKDGEQETATAEPPLHLGAVHQVYPEQGFALLRIIGPIPAGGTVLITHPMDGTNSRIGNLVVSSDFATRSNIIAADIRSGLVVKGDRVFQYRSISRSSDEDETENAQGPRPIIDSVPDSVVDSPTPSDLQPEPRSDAPAEPLPGTDEEPDVIPEAPPVEPTAEPTGGSTSPPAYLDDIPDDISGWN